MAPPSPLAGPEPSDGLPSIPVIDADGSEDPALTAMRQAPDQARLLLDVASRTYTPIGLRVADALSRRWSNRFEPHYAGAVAEMDRHVTQTLGRRGTYLLNHSYEWGCTAGAVEDPDGGVTLLRTLDWPLEGLGRGLVVTRWTGAAGPILSVTWPGYVGMLSGLAPGRFAIAINQPPLPLPWAGRAGGWVWARFRVWRSGALPPERLLRIVFETCPDFDAAVAMLRQTPICLPAVFTVAGPRPGQAIVIERTESQAFVPAEPAAANHWAGVGTPNGTPRDRTSGERRTAMVSLVHSPPAWSLDWAVPPVLLPATRLTMMANPATGRVLVRGYESDGPATRLLALP